MRFALPRRLGLALVGLALSAAFAPAQADGDRSGARVPLLPAYKQECGSCHLAYPPHLLPAASWQRLMNDLPHHFGTDASLDATTLRQIDGWLTSHAGRARDAGAPPEDRITRSPWFVREHRKVSAATWARPSIRSASQCAACHTRADQGVFDEHDIRIPR
jgi:mono/diheme cytochrome c family protein